MIDRVYEESRYLSGDDDDDVEAPNIPLYDLGNDTFAPAVMQPPGNATHISGAGDHFIKSSGGILIRIIDNDPIALGVATIFDSLTASGTTIAELKQPLGLTGAYRQLDYYCRFSTGLAINTTVSANLTVIWV